MIISLISCWCWYNVIRSNCFRLIFLFHQFCNSCEALQLYGYEKLAISCLFYFSILPDTGLWSLCNISGWINSSFCVNLTLGCVSCPKHCCIFTLPYGTNFDNCNWLYLHLFVFMESVVSMIRFTCPVHLPDLHLGWYWSSFPEYSIHLCPLFLKFISLVEKNKLAPCLYSHSLLSPFYLPLWLPYNLLSENEVGTWD